MYAVIRIRGIVNVSPRVKKTFELLNLKRANNMSLWQESPQMIKMIKAVESYATFGKINDEMLKEVIEKKGQAFEGKLDTKKVLEEIKKGKTLNEVGLVNCFRLMPPRKGFERNGIKKSFSIGGALGNRGGKINDLIKRML